MPLKMKKGPDHSFDGEWLVFDGDELIAHVGFDPELRVWFDRDHPNNKPHNPYASNLGDNKAEMLEKLERRRAKKNPAPKPGKKALEMYETFNGYQPKKIGSFPSSFRIPTSTVLAGDAIEVLYRSSKLDPITRRAPKKPIDYIHDHDAGVKVYRSDLDGDEYMETRVPSFITSARELVLLGECLGLAYGTDIGDYEMQVKAPYPELYTIPSGKALIVVQDKREVVALVWGGKLGVEWRGIVH